MVKLLQSQRKTFLNYSCMERLNQTNPINLARAFAGTLVITLLIRGLLAYFIPISGDEAYFIDWGKHPALGYYDHTPLLGWILYALLFFGDSISLMRLPAVLLPSCIALGLVWTLKRYDRSKAYLSGILFLLSPASLVFVFITTDVPLVFFSVFSCIFLWNAIKQEDNLFYYTCSGLCLGLAFFSKYIAVLLAGSYLLFYCFSAKTKARYLGFTALFLCVLPFGLVNLYWNYTHNWANIVFNIYDRNRFLKFNWEHPVFYLLSVIYIIGPVAAYYILKSAKTIAHYKINILSICIAFPLLFFLILSFEKPIGFHWVFSFTTLIFFCLWYILDQKQMLHSIKFCIGFNYIQLLIILFILALPIQTWKQLGWQNNHYASLISNLKHRDVRNYLNKYNADFIFATHSFSDATLMTYDSKLPTYVFGYGSEHGRQSDFEDDFTILNNKNILIYSDDVLEMQDYMPYFEYAELKSFDLYGARFYYILGYHFKYLVYREKILRIVKDYFWHIPNYLPHKSNFYCQKYFSDENCM